MKQKSTALLVALAVALVMSVGIAPAWGYFTSNDQALGGQEISTQPNTTPSEEYGNRTKNVTVTNTGKTAVFVRARAYASEALTIEGTGWSKDGDWYYFADPVEPGDATAALTVTLNFPEGATAEDEYNVVVVYESTPVLYDEDGNATADWDYILDSETEEGGN